MADGLVTIKLRAPDGRWIEQTTPYHDQTDVVTVGQDFNYAPRGRSPEPLRVEVTFDPPLLVPVGSDHGSEDG